MHYQRHIFMCLNVREGEKKACGPVSERYFAWFKDAVKRAGLLNQAVRVNRAGCLGRCESGPCLVIYPEGVWYRFENEEDLGKILKTHLIEGGLVEALLLP